MQLKTIVQKIDANGERYLLLPLYALIVIVIVAAQPPVMTSSNVTMPRIFPSESTTGTTGKL